MSVGKMKPQSESSRLIRFWGTFRLRTAQQPGTLSPDPWHFSLFANSMSAGRRAGSSQAGVGRVRTCLSEDKRRSEQQPVTAVGFPTMLLVQSGKCQGFGDRVPKSHRSMRKPDEPFLRPKVDLISVLPRFMEESA
jgi:hypothetical protein